MSGAAPSPLGALEVDLGDEVFQRWAALALPGDAPELDPASEALVVFTVPDDACPEALAGLGDLDDGVLEPELVSVVNECQEPLIPRTYALRAGPEIVVERGTETFQARATELGREERDKVWERHKVDAPGFADYEAKTSRVIPVIALDRTG